MIERSFVGCAFAAPMDIERVSVKGEMHEASDEHFKKINDLPRRQLIIL